jgi:putative ABC transport system permease protein
VRKQRELSLLRLIGYSTGAIALFPIVQAVLSAFLGAFLAFGVSIAVAPFVNGMFKGEVHSGEQVFRLLPQHFAVALALTVGCAVLAACWGGARAARIAPGEGLREE